MRRACILALLAGCQARTELMIGVATDIKAPDLVDTVQLAVTRVDNGEIEQQETWDLTGNPDEPFNLPGSFGVYSNGDEIKLDIELDGIKGTTNVVSRRAVVNLIAGQTLFLRLGLTAGCAGKMDCTATESCVEGVCKDVTIDARQLPDFSPDLVTELTCNSGVNYIDTSTGMSMPLSADAGMCPNDLCTEGTCLTPAPPPDPSTTRTIMGSQFTTFVTPNTTKTVPSDLSSMIPVALIPDGSGGYTTITGTGTSTGTFEIAAVPEGPYYLKVGTSFYVTSSSSFDLSSDTLGRPDAVLATQPTTTITVDLSNLDTWSDGTGGGNGVSDQLEAYSADLNTWWFDLEQGTPITNGVTTVPGYPRTTQESNNSGQSFLIQAGDDFAVAQLSSKTTTQGTPYIAASRFFGMNPAGFSQVDGGTTATVNVALMTESQSNTFEANFPVTKWDAAVGFNGTNAVLINPQAIPLNFLPENTLFIIGQPGGLAYCPLGASSDFLEVTVPHGSPDLTAQGMTYATPAQPGEVWAPYFGARNAWQVSFQLPGATTPTVVLAFFGFESVVPTGNAPIVPLISPVLQPTIAGLDLFSAQTVDPTPTIAWQAPMTGAPTEYVVTVIQLSIDASQATQQTTVATLTTTATSIAIPPGILIAGQTFVFTIDASNAPNPAAPNRTALPSADATIISAMITISGGSDGKP